MAVISGRALRALGRLALKEEEGGVRDPRSYVHVRPGRSRSGDAPEMVAEVCDGRVFVRYSEPGVVDRGCLIRRDTTDRAQPKDEVKIRGCRVTLAPGVTIAGAPSSGEGAWRPDRTPRDLGRGRDRGDHRRRVALRRDLGRRAEHGRGAPGSPRGHRARASPARGGRASRPVGPVPVRRRRQRRRGRRPRALRRRRHVGAARRRGGHGLRR